MVARRLELVDIDSLEEFERNPREHDTSQVEDIAAMIREVGFIVPPIVDEKRRVILAGHARLAAARMVGLQEVPIIPVGHLSQEQQIAFVIADNRLAERATWDRDALASWESQLIQAGFDATLTGFSQQDIDEMLAELAKKKLPEAEPPVPAPPTRPISRLGDVWILGSHRVMCGDSTSLEAILELTQDEPIDVVWTDPPYNVNYQSKAGSLENDGLSPAAFNAMLAAAFATMFRVMRAGAPIYVAHSTTALADFYSTFVGAGFKLTAGLVWVKNSLVMSRGDYHYRHEPIMYGWKPGAKHRWYGSGGEQTVFEFDDPPFSQVADDEWQIVFGEKCLIVKGQDITVRPAPGTVFFEKRPTVNREHPTMKPVPLVERMLRNSARAGAHVLDCFGGSGTTLIASEHLGLKAHLMELSPSYVDVIVLRWQQYTGQVAVHAETGKSFAQSSRRRK